MHDNHRAYVARPEQRDEEERVVRADDPSLSPEAVRLLTRELRDAIGSGTVRVVPGRERRRGGAATAVARNPLLLISLLAALTVGAIVALLTHSWWVLVTACGVHAVGTLLAGSGVFSLMTRREHVSPEVAVRLQDEGVADPDRVLTELVRDARDDRGPARRDPVGALIARHPAALFVVVVAGVVAFMTLMGIVVQRL